MKKFLLLLISFVVISLNINVMALDLNSQNVVLYNLNDDDVIYDMKKDEVVSVASLTKIMTTLVAIENIKDFDEYVFLREEMFLGLREANAYVINLKALQKVTYNDLLYGMFLASGADATRAIAISIAGNEDIFVELMNKKAEELGLKNTHFQNTVGLDADNHYSTVNEIAILLKSAIENEKFREIFTTESYTFSDGSITVQNSMKKAAKIYGINVSYILGSKTGYTGNAGRCLASIAYDKENDISYLLVTTKAKKVEQPILDATSVYNYYFENYKYQTIVSKNDLLVKLNTKYSKEKYINIYADKDIKKYLKNDYKKEDIRFKYNGKNIITPLMKKNEKIGKVDIIYKDEIVQSIEIRLLDNINFSFIGFLTYYRYIFIVSLVGVGCFILLFLTIRKKY